MCRICLNHQERLTIYWQFTNIFFITNQINCKPGKKYENFYTIVRPWNNQIGALINESWNHKVWCILYASWFLVQFISLQNYTFTIECNIKCCMQYAAYFMLFLVHIFCIQLAISKKIWRIKLTSGSIYSLSDKKFSSNNGLGFRNLTLGGN